MYSVNADMLVNLDVEETALMSGVDQGTLLEIQKLFIDYLLTQ
jgi:hypothetical protein